MKEIIDRALEAFNQLSDDSWTAKPRPEKWSKKEILGHLIDSAINNLQRFTEIQYVSKPYVIRPYNQDELVKANRYQHLPIKEIITFWTAINSHIDTIIRAQTPESFRFEVVTPQGDTKNLAWLIQDYMDHHEHHLRQILGEDWTT